MSDIHGFTLLKTVQVRTDFALIDPDLEVFQKQLALLPTRREHSPPLRGEIEKLKRATRTRRSTKDFR